MFAINKCQNSKNYKYIGKNSNFELSIKPKVKKSITFLVILWIFPKFFPIVVSQSIKFGVERCV